MLLGEFKERALFLIGGRVDGFLGGFFADLGNKELL